MVITTNGYIYGFGGLCGADGKNNDARILNHMLNDSTSILRHIQPNDVMILDRRFRDVIRKLKDLGIRPFMPHLLPNNEKQFTTLKANESRCITMIRWMVESVNGRIKNKFNFFAGGIHNDHVKHLKSYFEIACAIINAYSPPLSFDSPAQQENIQNALRRVNVEKDLQRRIQESGMERKRSK